MLLLKIHDSDTNNVHEYNTVRLVPSLLSLFEYRILFLNIDFDACGAHQTICPPVMARREATFPSPSPSSLLMQSHIHSFCRSKVLE